MAGLILYHRTSIAMARRVVRHGFQDYTLTLGLTRSGADHEVEVTGVWLTDRPIDVAIGPPGDALLEVRLGLDEKAISPFAIGGDFHDAKLWIVPARVLNPRVTVCIKEVDPNTSWWYDRHTG